MSQTATPRFYVAPFAFDGELQGIGAWQMSALSNRWLDFGRDILRSGGASFGGLLPPPFEHVGLRFTSAHGAALATFSLGGVPVASSAYLRGEDAVAERELLEMFVDSLRRVDAVRQSQTTSQPFAEVFGISERPLHVVVAWGASSEEDSQMIAQWALILPEHFCMDEMPFNQALQRTRPSCSGCNPRLPGAGSLSFCRWADEGTANWTGNSVT